MEAGVLIHHVTDTSVRGCTESSPVALDNSTVSICQRERHDMIATLLGEDQFRQNQPGGMHWSCTTAESPATSFNLNFEAAQVGACPLAVYAVTALRACLPACTSPTD